MSQLYYRTRAQVRWPAASGLAAWAVAQMDVRYQQSVYIRQGEPAEEAPVNHEPEPGLFVCDLILADQAAADDAFATLSAASVLSQAEVLAYEDDVPVASWIDVVECDHAFEVREGSVRLQLAQGSVDGGSGGGGGIPDWEPWTSGLNEDLYQVGDEVMHNGQHWRATVGNNHWEPGVYGWELVV